MHTWLCVTPERYTKTYRIMHALEQGMYGEGQITTGLPPLGQDPFIVWGVLWTALKAIPEAMKINRPFWSIDNGYWLSAKGSAYGYYRFTYRSPSPVLLHDPSPTRAQRVEMKPWRTDGKHVLIAMPGIGFGWPMGIDTTEWRRTIVERVTAETDRPIVVRTKDSRHPLRHQLKNCWALVTHSSNAAFEAVLAGVPVFVAPTSACAPVGRIDLNIEQPVMPDRDHWLRSLMCQQYTLSEMREGLAYKWMRKVIEQVDHVTLPALPEKSETLPIHYRQRPLVAKHRRLFAVTRRR